MTKLNHLLVNERFGPTVQGEGPSIGKVCYFIRLNHCPLECRWCDSAFAWRYNKRKNHNSQKVYDPKKEIHPTSFTELWAWLKEEKAKFLVVTGGEPLLQYKQLIPFLREAILRPHTQLARVEIETAGVMFPTELSELIRDTNTRDWLYFNVSPKLENSGNSKEARFNQEALERFNFSNRAAFKFVVTEPGDFREILEIIEQIKIPSHKVWIMAEGTSDKKLNDTMMRIVDDAINFGFNLTPRLHVQLWGNKRGV